jgi:hypothetical protein
MLGARAWKLSGHGKNIARSHPTHPRLLFSSALLPCSTRCVISVFAYYQNPRVVSAAVDREAEEVLVDAVEVGRRGATGSTVNMTRQTGRGDRAAASEHTNDEQVKSFQRKRHSFRNALSAPTNQHVHKQLVLWYTTRTPKHAPISSHP